MKILLILAMVLIFVDLPIRASPDIPVWIEVGNIYQGYQIKFTEPFEIMYFLFRDGTVVKFTNQLADSVYLIGMEEVFKKHNLKFPNILIVIHNHLTIGRFSPRDIQLYYYLKGEGFNGDFCIFYPHSNKVLFYKQGRAKQKNSPRLF